MVSSASVKSSLSSASKDASISLSRASSSASSALSSASAKASAAAADGLNSAGEAAKSHWSALTIIAVITTVLAMAVVGLYFSGQADDLLVYLAKKYYKVEAKAEEKALEKAGTEKAESFLKDRLKKNPMMGEDELNQAQSGLGGEAVRDGLAGVSGKLGGLGKL